MLLSVLALAVVSGSGSERLCCCGGLGLKPKSATQYGPTCERRISSAQRSTSVDCRESRRGAVVGCRAAARTAILSSSSPSSGLPWASVAIRAADRGSESRLYCGNSNMGEHQRRPQQQTAVGKQPTVQCCAYVHSSRQIGECKGREAPSYREKPQIRSPCTQSFAQPAQSTAAALQGRCAFRGTNRHSQAALMLCCYARIVCSTRGR
jgi:hypothetical protein